MCDPVTAIAAGSLVIGAGSAIAQHKAQAKASKANEAATLASMRESWTDIGIMQVQEGEAAAMTVFEADRQARGAKALAAVSAGEAGVSGASVEALLGDIDRKAGEFKTAEKRNLENTLIQLQREKVSQRTVAQGRIASVPRPNAFATGLTIAGLGLDFASGVYARSRPTRSGS